MSRRRRNQNRNHTPRNAQHTQIVNNTVMPSSVATDNTTDEALPLYQAETTPLEPSPRYFENIPQVQIEHLPEQTSFSITHNTLQLCCRKWQFETIVDFPPHELLALNMFSAIFRIESYSENYNTIVANFFKTITEFHVMRLTEGGADVLWETGYRLVLPDRPWPEDELRAANRDEYR